MRVPNNIRRGTMLNIRETSVSRTLFIEPGRRGGSLRKDRRRVGGSRVARSLVVVHAREIGSRDGDTEIPNSCLKVCDGRTAGRH